VLTTKEVVTMSTPSRDLVVVGASAGGVEALRALVAGLGEDLPAAVAVVLHLPAGGTSALPQILRRAGALPAITPTSGTPVRPGMVYVAPPDHHLLVVEDRFTLSHGPTENSHRPAINALFRSAAMSMGPRVTGVVLSGVLDDGVAGLVAIKSRGGLAVVQDPADALYPGMPENAIRHVLPDHVVPVAEIGPLLTKLTGQDAVAGAVGPTSALLELEHEIAQNRRIPVDYEAKGVGRHSGFSCPDCQGVLSELGPDESRYRCRVGHAWSADALLYAQGDAFQRALWTALRSLDEKAGLAQRMHREASRRGNNRLAERYRRTVEETNEAAELLRKRLTAMPVETSMEIES
jgi:two-component system, chemotaxis family, protein-glutamate methylesterase/glutaminase